MQENTPASLRRKQQWLCLQEVAFDLRKVGAVVVVVIVVVRSLTEALV